MIGAHYFNKIDWHQTTPEHFIFAEKQDIHINGNLFKPSVQTGLLFEIKRLNLVTNEFEHFGFSY